MAISHQEARDILTNAFPDRDQAWYQIVQAITFGEGDYGNGWKNGVVDGTGAPWVDESQGDQFFNEGEGSNNWGAIQGGPPSFRNLDHHANGAPYQGLFKIYGTPEAGATDFVNQLLRIMNRHDPGESVLSPNESGLVSAVDVATTMRAGGYFELAADKYAKKLFAGAKVIANALGEDLFVTSSSLLDGGSSSGSGGTVALGLLFLYGLYRILKKS